MIKINGERWRVQVVPPAHPMLSYKSGPPAIGCCDKGTKTIYISNIVSKPMLKKVLRHEMVHAFMYSYNVSMSDEVEELVADIFTEYGDKIINFTNIIYNKIK